jgi:hypothetical protein
MAGVHLRQSDGRDQVVLRRFDGRPPLSETQWQVSSSSEGALFAREPRWRADSKGLFYLDRLPQSLRVMSVEIGAGPNPVGTPKALFEFRNEGSTAQSNVFDYAPSSDGQRFLVDEGRSDPKPTLNVILNWAGGK